MSAHEQWIYPLEMVGPLDDATCTQCNVNIENPHYELDEPCECDPEICVGCCIDSPDPCNECEAVFADYNAKRAS